MNQASLFIQPEWPAPKNIKAYTSLRQGGGSSLPPYDQFNLALHVEDQIEAVNANRQKLRQLLRLPTEPLWLNQNHGTTVVEAPPAHQGLEADASFTRQPGQVCAIMTADCLPILVCNQSGTQAAAIHAGWRGLAKGIIPATLRNLADQPQQLLTWLGPAIGPQNYEVGVEVYQTFVTLDPANETAFTQTSTTSWLADLYELARRQLRSLGVEQIYGGNYCTYSQAADFFSYRRAKGKTGRMVSLIWIEQL